MVKIKTFFSYLLILIVALALFSCGTLQELWVHDLKNKSIDKIKSFISSDSDRVNPHYDLMTEDKCKATNSLMMVGKNLSFDELKEREKITTFEIIANVACITKIEDETTGMFLMKDLNIIAVDPRDIEKAVIQLENF